eukprot:3244380-Pyramimonas_sp.AAC.1
MPEPRHGARKLLTSLLRSVQTAAPFGSPSMPLTMRQLFGSLVGALKSAKAPRAGGGLLLWRPVESPVRNSPCSSS